MGSGRRRRSAILCRHRSTSKVAITVHPLPTHRRYSWSPPLALPPAISGDKTNIVGCARAWRTFLLLGKEKGVRGGVGLWTWSMDHEVTRVGLPMYYCCCCPSASACIFFPVERVCVAHRLVDICASPTSVSTLLRLHRSASRIFGLITRSSARLQRLLQPIFIEHPRRFRRLHRRSRIDNLVVHTGHRQPLRVFFIYFEHRRRISKLPLSLL
uniref:Uncharacterized protein n=1 Tax=Oryza barthii TaxID=65489 RepID=A0A0D3GGX9_9ORYZ